MKYAVLVASGVLVALVLFKEIRAEESLRKTLSMKQFKSTVVNPDIEFSLLFGDLAFQTLRHSLNSSIVPCLLLCKYYYPVAQYFCLQ